MNQLEQLKKFTKVVADTGDIDSIKQYSPVDATTNPSLILKAAQQSEYHHLIHNAIEYSEKNGTTKEEKQTILLDKLTVNFGCEILKTVPGRVSTEVDARLSFDTKASVEKGKKLIEMYQEAGVDKERVLIKLASTWEGIKAGEELEKMGIHCNMTLMFSLAQAVACAEANVSLISPFVGRILDWYKKAEGVDSYPPEQDPGVISVKKIFNYYKKFNHNTQIMGASFRNVEEITELAGSDLLTIAPQLLETLQNSTENLTKKLDTERAQTLNLEQLSFNENSFRFALNDDPMATEKLSEGIRNFVKDTVTLEKFIAENFLTESPSMK